MNINYNKFYYETIRDWKNRATSILQIESAIITIFASGLTISMSISQSSIYLLFPVIAVHIISIILIVCSMVTLLYLVKFKDYDFTGDLKDELEKFSTKFNLSIIMLVISLILESIVAPLIYFVSIVP